MEVIMINNQWQCCQSCHRDRELRLSEKRLYSSFQFSSSVCYCNCHKTRYWEKAEFLIKAPLWLNMNKSKLYSCSFHPQSWHSQVTEVKTRALSLCNSPQRPRAVQKRRCFYVFITTFWRQPVCVTIWRCQPFMALLWHCRALYWENK